MAARLNALVVVALLLCAVARCDAAPEQGLTADQLVQMALEANPQIKAARARWKSAEHSVKQNYAPADPVFTYLNVDSKNGLSDAGLHSHQFTESFQFPGKAILQADIATRTARVAGLAYGATIRDVRAQAESAYYQDLLDGALADVTADTVASLKQVLQVTQVAYSANQVTQTDFISAEFDLAAARQQGEQSRTAEQNDRTVLNQLMFRPVDEPLPLDRHLELKALSTSLDTMVEAATEVRQEILQAALNERNTETALTLAKLEYAPDYSLGYTFDWYLIPGAAPTLNATQAHTISIGFNLPVFFWIKQREDVEKARFDLEAARDDLGTIKSQTAAAVTTLYRSAQLACRTAILYRDTLIPLARQDFQVALVAYSSGKIDFSTLAAALRRSYDSRVVYLQAANQFLAGEVALEQAIGEPLPK